VAPHIAVAQQLPAAASAGNTHAQAHGPVVGHNTAKHHAVVLADCTHTGQNTCTVAFQNVNNDPHHINLSISGNHVSIQPHITSLGSNQSKST
jgi:hypothetical protein